MFLIMSGIALGLMFTGVCMDDEEAGMFLQVIGAMIGLVSLGLA